MTVHYKYGGSTAARTLRCNGWVALASTLPKSKGDNGSIYADQGTMLHECCEILEDTQMSYEELLAKGVRFNDSVLDEDSLEKKVVPAMEALDDWCEEYNFDTVLTEKTIEFEDNIGGTADIFASNSEVIGCGDYKFGDGVMVNAEDNKQMYFCTWIALEDGLFDDVIDTASKVVFAIIQPSFNREVTLDTWETTIDEVWAFGAEFIAAVETAENTVPGEGLVTGSHCRFCPASAICPKKTEGAQKALQMLDLKSMAKSEEIPAGKVFDLDEALALAKELEPWVKDVFAFAHSMIEQGAQVPGWKLVQKRSHRKWADEDQVTKYLKRKLTAKVAVTEKVITPAKAEAAAKKMKVKLRLKDMITTGVGGSTLVPDTDKRPALENVASISDALNKLNTEED